MDMGDMSNHTGMDHGGGGGGGNQMGTVMHMTFFWGSSADILFSGWPGTAHPGMYALALIFVFALSVLVEWLSHCRLLRADSCSSAANRVKVASTQTLIHALRVGLAYLVMLAVMSFNGGVFLVVVAGHALGFLVFGSRLFKNVDTEKVGSDLPPLSC